MRASRIAVQGWIQINIQRFGIREIRTQLPRPGVARALIIVVAQRREH